MKYLIVTIINKLRINVGDFKDPLTASSTFVNLVLFIKYFDSWIRIQEARGSNGSESKVLQKRSLFNKPFNYRTCAYYLLPSPC